MDAAAAAAQERDRAKEAASASEAERDEARAAAAAGNNDLTETLSDLQRERDEARATTAAALTDLDQALQEVGLARADATAAMDAAVAAASQRDANKAAADEALAAVQAELAEARAVAETAVATTTESDQAPSPPAGPPADDPRVAELEHQVGTLRAELEEVEALLAASESPAAPPLAAAPAASANGGPDLGELTSQIEAHWEYLATGLDTWKGVEMQVGQSVNALLGIAMKDPTLQPTLFPLLEKLQAALDQGRGIVQSSHERASAERDLLASLK